MNSLRFFINRDSWGSVSVDFVSRESNGKRMVAMPVVMSLVEANGAAPEPMMCISEADAPEALQSLMDELWRLGVRPADIGTPGHLAATTKHLEDMRAITFGKLEIQKP